MQENIKNQNRNQRYKEQVQRVTPVRNLWIQMLKAFVIGGLFCLFGEFLTQMMSASGMEQEIAGNYTSMLLILLSVLLTGFQIYPSIAEFAGAGILVPITGFANSVASAAIEYQKEGQVFGIGCKIFIIAGPVILYGIFTSWVLGVIYWIMTAI
ncbi:MAG: SpoVA/SpoVAEb family sporulation membrane protein [Clostridia bacterium]|nr:SpoVA/SpoVAEb family sporulation membrane protein [Clostridia bacterium]